MAFKIITYRGWKRFWWRAFSWFSSQFAAIQTALTDLDVDVDLSGVANDSAVAEQTSPSQEPNLVKVGNNWYAFTGVWSHSMPIYKILGFYASDMPEYIGVSYITTVGASVFYATATEIDLDRPFGTQVSEVKTVRLSKVLDLIGTPASGQQSTLFGALGNINFSQLKDDLQGTDPTVTLTAIYEYLAGQTPEDIPEGLGDRINLLLQFFGLPQALPEYQPMTEQEVTDELEDIMQALDPELEQEVEYPEGSGTYMTKAQAITAQAMQIINDDEEQS